MRRALMCVPLALFILAFGEGGALGVTREWTDPYPEGFVNAFDISRVTVSDPSGSLSVSVREDNWAGIGSGDRLDVYFNTDRNAATGCPSNYTCYGADYAAIIQDSASNCGVYSWGGGQWNLVTSLACPFSFGVTFTFPRSYIGNPPHFDLWAASYYGNESDRAPNGGSWFYDDTPPETAITSGPSGSTPDRNASFGFTSSEPGSTFACSLDGAAFTGCASGASYAGLGFGSHTFRVQATDSSGNTDPSPASRTWTIVDATAPTARAVKGSCCTGNGEATLQYRIDDNSGAAASSVAIYRSGRSKPANVCSFAMDNVPRTYAAPCKVPASARGWLRFCVQGSDAAGNSSASSCKRIVFSRLNTDLVWRYADLGGGAARITKFRFRGQRGRASVRCRGCTLRAGVVGTVLRPGARIEARVTKPRWRGYYVRLTNRGGAVVQFEACLPPGLSGPLVSCAKTSGS